jgi:hypothetical protein
MGSEDEAKKGLEKHGTVIEDRHLVVSRQENDFESWKTTVVCCLNIPFGKPYILNIAFCCAQFTN